MQILLWLLVVLWLVHQQTTCADDAGVCCDCFASETDGGVCSVSIDSSTFNCCCGSVVYDLNANGHCEGDAAHSVCELCPSSLPSLPCCDCPAAASSEDVGGICPGGEHQNCCCADLVHNDSLGTDVCPSSKACKSCGGPAPEPDFQDGTAPAAPDDASGDGPVAQMPGKVSRRV